jgi:hypothetical protein
MPDIHTLEVFNNSQCWHSESNGNIPIHDRKDGRKKEKKEEQCN